MPVDPIVGLDPIDPMGIVAIPDGGMEEEPIVEGPLPKKALTCGLVR